jgi:hypothetical protein
MSNSVLLSALTVIALTGITLTGLKYRSDNDDHTDVVTLNDDDDYDYSMDSIESNRINPKFHFYNVIEKNQSTESVIVKRSVDNSDQYPIEDRNMSMIDDVRREKVKQVQIAHDGLTISVQRYFVLLSN